MNSKRFRVAFFFAGEKRDFVSKVADILAKHFGQDHILYDKFHEAGRRETILWPRRRAGYRSALRSEREKEEALHGPRPTSRSRHP